MTYPLLSTPSIDPQTHQVLAQLRFWCGSTLRVITRTLFGQGLSAADVDKVGALIACISAPLLLGILGRSLPSWAPIPGTRAYQRKRQELDAIVNKIIISERASKTPLRPLRIARTPSHHQQSDKRRFRAPG